MNRTCRPKCTHAQKVSPYYIRVYDVVVHLRTVYYWVLIIYLCCTQKAVIYVRSTRSLEGGVGAGVARIFLGFHGVCT